MIKRLIKSRMINPVSIRAIHKMADSDVKLKNIWNDSLRLLPHFRDHYSFVVDSEEIENRIRLLVVGETSFVRKEIDRILTMKGTCSYADVGDSDGSVRLLLKDYFPGKEFYSVGINLQPGTVEKIRNKGLDAICADAISLTDRGIRYDIVSAFETLEHLSDPIGFLNGVRNVVKDRLLLSVPFIRHSRIGLDYLLNKLPEGSKPTIENTHIFELSPKDWKKIFLHTGWKLGRDWKLLMFPSYGISRLILQPFWRFVSFEGFWFVSLYEDTQYSSQYAIE